MRAIIFILLIFAMTNVIFGQPTNYFQQEVHYTINVKLHPVKKTYAGDEQLVYKNNSPDTLHYLWMHLYPNAYKNTKTPFALQEKAMGVRSFYFSKPEDRGYLEVANVRCNGKQTTYSFNANAIDEIKIQLLKPLFPGDSLQLSLTFKGKFPKVFSRMGYFGKYYFAATQWYPKMVVYDRFGWHPDSYLNMGEFYGEYGTFDVRITVPQCFVVDATGLLQDNPKEKAFLQGIVDTTEYLISLNKKERKRFVRRWKKDRLLEMQSNKKTKTLHFIAKNVHNFAWFCGAQYLMLRKVHNNGVLTNVLVTPENAYGWRNVPDYVKRTIAFYSQKVGPFQYPKASVVDGALSAGGGMEYPMITIISMPNISYTHLLEDVVAHEVGHNWFMAMLGSDERASTFLDEGVNSFLEYKYLTHYFGRYNLTDFKKLFWGHHILDDFGYLDMMHLSYGLKLSTRTDQPLNLRAEAYSPGNYGAINYHKGVALLMALEWYLTPPVFWKGMHEYYKRWNGKHPTVQDFFAVFEDVSGKNLQRFVDDWYNTTRFNDFVLADYSTQTQGSVYETKVWVKNKGSMKDFSAPVYLITQDGDTLEQRWLANPNQPVVFTHQSPVKHIEVNLKRLIFENNYLNNAAGLPKIEVHFFPQIPKFDAYPVNIFPSYWYENFVDKHRVGLFVQTGNPVLMQYFTASHLFYATQSRKWEYGVKMQHRFHFSLANYTDAQLEALDEDGMRRQSLAFLNKWQNPKDDFTNYQLRISFDYIDLYNAHYYNSDFFKQANYFSGGTQFLYSAKRMLNRWQIKVQAEKGFSGKNTKHNFWRLESNMEYKHYFGFSDYLHLHSYFGGVSGSGIPLQEMVFAFGNLDAKHKRWLPFHRGAWAPGRHWSTGQGMNMFGYNNPSQSFFAGKYGASLSANLKIWYLPKLYYSIAVLSDRLKGFGRKSLFSEAGIKAGISMNFVQAQFVFPLYVDHPIPGDKRLAFRYVFSLKISGIPGMF